MRKCPVCASQYADGVGVCERDGQVLVPLDVAEARASASDDAPATRLTLSTPVTASPSTSDSVGAGALAAGALATGGPSASGAGGGATSAAGALAPSLTPADVPATAAEPAASEGFDSLVGATLANRYRIVRRIGEGGMGAVYEAKHTIIGKRVAVKVLLEKFLTKSDFVARLLQEARLASAIGHEHIVDVTDFGTTDDGRAFVVMEFLEGEALSQLVMREAPLPVERALQIARQVASALGAAHAKGIVHRDVKPENIYLLRRGDADFIKVVDFGISKAVKQGQSDDGPDYRLTHTGLLLGTPLYMSPEQARGEEDLDHRVDVWALGVLLYECLTGEVPFRANNYLGIISQVLTHEALSPSKLRPELGISEAVETVVMRAMEKDRARRYPTMADVEADLDRLLAGDHNVGAGTGLTQATAPPPSNPARGRLWIWSGAVAALIGGVAMALARPEPRDPTPEVSPAHESTIAGAASADKPRPDQAGTSPTSPAGAGSAVGAAVGTPGAEAPNDPGTVPDAVETGARPSRPLARPGNHPGREKVDRHVVTRPKSEPAPTGRPSSLEPPRSRRTTDEVLRGALPSRSGEGYPDLP